MQLEAVQVKSKLSTSVKMFQLMLSKESIGMKDLTQCKKVSMVEVT